MPLQEDVVLEPTIATKISTLNTSLDDVISAYEATVETLNTQLEDLKSQKNALNIQIKDIQDQIDAQTSDDVKVAKAMKKVGELIKADRPIPPMLRGILV